MKTVKLYGGPAHGREHPYDHLPCRIEVAVQDMIEMDRHRYRDLEKCPITMPVYERNTYYLKQLGCQGITEAGSTVRKIIHIGVWEHGQADLSDGLTTWEYGELLRELNHQYWEWAEEPNILTHFHRWWEKAIHENGWQPVFVH
jgi:hypothetical protein